MIYLPLGVGVGVRYGFVQHTNGVKELLHYIFIFRYRSSLAQCRYSAGELKANITCVDTGSGKAK